MEATNPGARMSTAVLDTAAQPSRALHWSLWGVQALLAFAFFAAGVMKSVTPLPELGAMMPWVSDSPAFLPRFIGISEILGAVGLILPSALRILPVLTPVAAGALALVMALGVAMHAAYGEWGALGAPFVLFGLSAFVAWGRSTRARIPAR